MLDREKALKALDDFRGEIEFMYDTFKGQYMTRDDMKELAKQVFYAIYNIIEAVK